jgi:ABC-type multidrug transport system fused ATPase/permease subunit
VSATTAGSTVIVGIIGILIIWLGGRAIIAGQMTLGDLIAYMLFIGLVAAPLVSIASIGTQITEPSRASIVSARSWTCRPKRTRTPREPTSRPFAAT